MTRPLFVMTFVFVSLFGCQIAPRYATNPIGSTHVHLSNEDAVKQSLYAQLNEWKAVRYDYGGLSKEGVDCSGFVYVTYLSNFGIALPRTAAQQAREGQLITQLQLRAGDLVFFKTGRVSRHVGIFVDQRKFIHASKSQGVMISSLDDWYWSKKYWKATRIETDQSLAHVSNGRLTSGHL